MRILALVPGAVDTSPGQRFRLEQWARVLEGQGIEFVFAPFEDEALHNVIYQRGRYGHKIMHVARALYRRLAWLPRIRSFDAVLVHREAALLGPALLERCVARTGVPIVYDFDDPIWLTYRSPMNGALSILKCPGKVAAICRLAGVVIVGNRLLAGWAREHARHVEIVPSTIDLDRYPMKQPADGLLTLGWTGSHSTLQFLESLVPTLRRFAAAHAYRLLVISHTDSYRIDGLGADVVSRRWRAATEGEDLLDIDIGLAPFPDSGWTPWRCHGKVLQYMAAGIPTIASAIGILPDYITDGANGFLAASEEEWLDRLGRLADDATLRQRLGRAGRATIADCYSAAVWAPKVKEIFERAVSMSPSRSAAVSSSSA